MCCHTAAGNADSDSGAGVSTSVQEAESTSATTTATDQQRTRCRNLELKCHRLQRQLASKNIVCVNLRKKLKQALCKVRTVSKDEQAKNKAISRFLNSDQRCLLGKVTSSNRGSKWSQNTVKRALQLHFSCGPIGYNMLLSQNYPLPSLRTLRRRLQVLCFEPGVLCKVFYFLALKAETMTSQERECCLTLDEMSITSSVEYDSRTGHFLGDVTLPSHSGPATHCLVFMLAGLVTRWKQPVAYHYTGNSTDGSVFADIVLEIIREYYAIA